MTFGKHNIGWPHVLGIGYVVAVILLWNHTNVGLPGRALHVVLLFPLTLLLCMRADRIVSWWRKRKAEPDPKPDPMDIVEVPRLALIHVVHVPCRLCRRPLKDEEPVVWFEKKNGWKSELAHADCAVYIRWPDGRTTRGGMEVPTDGWGGIVGEEPRGSLLLTEAEWLSWLKTEAR